MRSEAADRFAIEILLWLGCTHPVFSAPRPYAWLRSRAALHVIGTLPELIHAETVRHDELTTIAKALAGKAVNAVNLAGNGRSSHDKPRSA